MPERMKIGELAERAGVSHRTIHYYEREGLLQPAERVGTGYRYYDDQSLARLQKVRQLQELGLSLDEIREVIDLYFEDATVVKAKRQVMDILEGHLRDAERRIEELEEFREDALKNLGRLETLVEEVEQDDSTDTPEAS